MKNGLIHTLCLLLVLSACSGAGTSTVTPPPTLSPTPRPTATPERVSEARFEPAPCPFVLPEGYEQGQHVDCGWLIVPENRDRLPARAIRLAVGIFTPPGGAAHPDPIVYLAGGPGGSILEAVRYQFDAVFAPVMVTARRALILLDQRGVGRSRPALDCPNVDALLLDTLDRAADEPPPSNQEIADRTIEAYLACAADLRRVADLTAYHSAASAADVDDLRRALGYEQVNLWGGSYGTRLALTVMRDHPHGVRSAVLDSVYPPDVDLYAAAPANLDRSLGLLFETCAASPVCSINYPDLERVFYDTVDRLNEQPVSSIITDTLTGQAYHAELTGDALAGFVFQILYETELKYLLPQFIHDASQGHLDAIDKIRGALLAQRTASSRGMMFSVQCREEIAFSSAETFQASLDPYPELAGTFENSVLGGLAYRVCAGWGAGRADPIENQPVVSDVSALVLAGEFDPVTPPAWSRHAAETLSHSYVYEYPGVGHGASAEPCAREMMIAFLDDPTTAPDDACMDR